MRFRRREVVFGKVEIRKETANVAEVNEKEDRAPGQVGKEVLVTPTPSPEATNSQVVMGQGVDEGHSLDAAPHSLTSPSIKGVSQTTLSHTFTHIASST